MGLKTTNYKSKSTGLTFPVAYAVLQTLLLDKNKVTAKFVVQTSREKANKYDALDKVTVEFIWDRKTDLAEMAYESAKKDKKEEVYINPETFKQETKIVYGLLYGWENDIVVKKGD